jgi:hypothetical protein
VARDGLGIYPSIEFKNDEVTSATKNESSFGLTISDGERYQSKTIAISTGLKGVLPDIDNISKFCGKSKFICPYCDELELRDRATGSHHRRPKTDCSSCPNNLQQEQDLVVCTNGNLILDSEQKQLLQSK